MPGSREVVGPDPTKIFVTKENQKGDQRSIN